MALFCWLLLLLLLLLLAEVIAEPPLSNKLLSLFLSRS